MPNEIKEDKLQIVTKKHEQINTEKPHYVASFFTKLPFFSVAAFLSYFLLYKECLNNNNVNPIVVTYFCIVCLTCLEIVGLPVSKLANMINK